MNETSLNLVESAILVLILDDDEAYANKEIIETMQFGIEAKRYRKLYCSHVYIA